MAAHRRIAGRKLGELQLRSERADGRSRARSPPRHTPYRPGHGLGGVARGRQSSTHCNFHAEAAASGDAVNRTLGRYRGFTLIEVLVSLSLMSLMATIMIASLELG